LSANKDFLDLAIKNGILTANEMGDVFRLGKKVKGSIGQYGYKEFIAFNGSPKVLKFHWVVWTVFKGRVPDGMVLDHINNIRTDNRLVNLQLLTRAENSAKAVYTSGRKRIKDYFVDIEKLRLGGKTMDECAEILGIYKTSIKNYYKRNNIEW
jgi:hypothetical protein